MKPFVLVMTILFIMNVACRIYYLAANNIPRRTPEDVGWSLVVEIALLIWASILLSV